ncbi:MAG: DUF4268 domain-containing protein [Victivallaceae bacterium]|jgi:hypothetical protein
MDKENHRKFWREAMPEILKAGCSLFADIKPAGRCYLAKSVGIPGIKYAVVAGTSSSGKQRAVRVEVVFEDGDEGLNCKRYNSVKAKEKVIRERFGGKLYWNEENGRKKYKICAEDSPFVSRNDNHKAVARWLGENIEKLKSAVKPYLEDLD